MRKFLTVVLSAALIATPALATNSATKTAQLIGPDITPCKVIATNDEKEVKRKIRELRRQGFHVEVTRKGKTEVVAQGGTAFPAALQPMNVVKSGC